MRFLLVFFSCHRAKKSKSQKLLSKWFSDQDGVHTAKEILKDSASTKIAELPMLDLGGQSYFYCHEQSETRISVYDGVIDMAKPAVPKLFV